ncbi:MAG: calcineurin-like phosphoesterase family protein [Rhodothermales bacterium]
MTYLSRRSFLKQAASTGGALMLTGRSWARPSRPAVVHVTGRVLSGGRPVADVPVSDGLTVVGTDESGAFEFISRSRQPFVFLSVPSAFRVPVSEVGTAAFYQPLAVDADGRADVRFELEAANGSTEEHAFVVLADPQTQTPEEIDLLHAQTVPDVIETVSGFPSSSIFGVACGDIMFDDLELYPDYERAVARMGVPFFQAVGNHDLDFDALVDSTSTRTFQHHFGPRYYSFDRGRAHYVVLDDVFWNHADYVGYLDEDQLSWLEADLARVAPGRLVVVFTHIPAHSTRYRREDEDRPRATGSISNRRALYDLLSPFDAHVISGHTHENEHVFEGGVHEHILGATCGAWWSGPICHDGTPNGYGVFEVDGDEIRWRYKATGRPADYQLRAYPIGSDASAPDEIVANVWDWDPEWTVTWYEDGVRRGLMARRTGTDPHSVELHSGEAFPEHRPWVDPVLTDHLFYAPVSPDAQRVVVEATNRWGESFTAAL